MALAGLTVYRMLGLLLYEMASGKQPFDDIDDPQQLISGLLSGSITTDPYIDELSCTVPLRLRQIMAVCTAFDPDSRPSAEEVAGALRALVRR